MTPISVSRPLGIVLNPASYTNPVIIEAGVTIYGGAFGVSRFLGSAVFFTIENHGTIVSHFIFGTGTGIYLAPGGSVTNSASGAISGDSIGIQMYGGIGTVVNYGRISGNHYSVLLGNGGLVRNAAAASITGGAIGVLVGGASSGGAGKVVNDGGRVTGATFGVELASGGSVTNAASGSITANNIGVYLDVGGSVTNAESAMIRGSVGGVEIRASGGTVVNSGLIAGRVANGVYLVSGGSVFNSSSGAILGGNQGVALRAGGTVTNAGTIIGGGGTAVALGGDGSNLLVLDPGFEFSGLVEGSASASNTLELASAASAGTVTGLGTQIINFGSIVFDAGAQWSIAGDTTGLAGVITGFAPGDTIEVTGVTATGSSFIGGILTLDEAVGSATLRLPLGSFSTASVQVTNNPDGAEVTLVAPCFCAGTRILTASGEVAVEELRLGDQVATLRGCQLAPIVWRGRLHVNCLGHPRPHDVWPIRVKAGAIGDGVPHRDLWLSPEHAILLGGEAPAALVPIRHLLNGSTIAQVPCATITYWHVELASHDAIVAEGLAAETYLDTGNRADFANGGPAITVHPTFADAVWRAKACAPQLRHGDALAALRDRLAIRAAGM